MVKAVLGLATGVLFTILAAKLAFDATAHTGAAPTNEPWALASMEFVTWNGEKWTGWVRDEASELMPQNEVKWRRHAKGSLAFLDWGGHKWQAKIDGEEFLVAHRGAWEESERAAAIRYRDWNGENQLRTVAQLRR